MKYSRALSSVNVSSVGSWVTTGLEGGGKVRERREERQEAKRREGREEGREGGRRRKHQVGL